MAILAASIRGIQGDKTRMERLVKSRMLNIPPIVPITIKLIPIDDTSMFLTLSIVAEVIPDILLWAL